MTSASRRAPAHVAERHGAQDERSPGGAAIVAQQRSSGRRDDHPRWNDLARIGLESADRQVFWQAERGARILGPDPFPQLLARIDADPLGGPWFQAWRGVDRDRAEVLVDRATRLLDLDSIATGPSRATGVGAGFEPHSALNGALQGLREHPGLGAHIIAAAMNSPSIQNRNGALDLLEATGPDGWSVEHHQQLAVLAATDPYEKPRQRAADLLASSQARRERGAGLPEGHGSGDPATGRPGAGG